MIDTVNTAPAVTYYVHTDHHLMRPLKMPDAVGAVGSGQAPAMMILCVRERRWRTVSCDYEPNSQLHERQADIGTNMKERNCILRM